MNKELVEKELLLKVAGYRFDKVERGRWYYQKPDDSDTEGYPVYPTKAVAVRSAWNKLMRDQNG